jgi:glycosyltransferase involved in cell wall biosynthesis
MASGLAVTAFDYGAAGANIRTGVSGWVAPFADRGAFIRGSVQLALDVALARRLGRKARETAVENGWNVILDQVESLYLRSISEFRARRSN